LPDALKCQKQQYGGGAGNDGRGRVGGVAMETSRRVDVGRAISRKMPDCESTTAVKSPDS
jgi:hypothetical protein